MNTSDLQFGDGLARLDQDSIGALSQQRNGNDSLLSDGQTSFHQRIEDNARTGQGIDSSSVIFSPVDKEPIDIRYQVSRGNQAKRFADHFDNIEIRRLSLQQLVLMRELASLSESHKALERTLRILKGRYKTTIEEYVFDEAQQMQPRIFEEGMLYRDKLAEFHKVTGEFEVVVSHEVITGTFIDLPRTLRWRREAQQNILETQHGALLLSQAEGMDKEVAQFVIQYEEALASSNTPLCLRLEASQIFGLYLDGFRNIEARFDIARHNGDIVRAKEQSDNLDYYASLHKTYPGFSREDFEYIFSTYGSYYEAALDTLRDLHQLAANLTTFGLPQAAEDLLDLHLKFSRIDGSPLGTPSQRIAFYNNMISLSPLEYKWYSQRPHFNRGDAVLKDFTLHFIRETLIPYFINNPDFDFSVEKLGLDLHRWLTRGSSAQFDILLDREYGIDISGVYRNNKVRLEDYIPPQPDRVVSLMSELDKKIQEFFLELELRKSQMSIGDYENAVIQIALYIQQVYVGIHPMRDGNGRVSRALCEVYIRKYLGETAYADVPVTRDSRGESRVHADLVPFNMRWTAANRRSQSECVDFDAVLTGATLDSVLNDELLADYRTVYKKLVELNN